MSHSKAFLQSSVLHSHQKMKTMAINALIDVFEDWKFKS